MLKRTYTPTLRIETERLLILPLTYRYAELALEYNDRNKDFFRPWLPAYMPNYFSIEFHRQWLKQDARQAKSGEKLKLFIFEKSDQNLKQIIGDMTFSNIVRGVLQSCFLGYKMDEKYNGKGLMTEALAHATQHVFEQMKLHRIEAHIMLQNTASQRVVEKLGFQREGISKSYLKINGTWEDHYRYALINQRYGTF